MPVSHRFYSAILAMVSIIAFLAFPGAAHALGPKADVFLGYSRLGSDTFYSHVGGLNGWQGALNVKIKPFVGIEGDVSQYGIGAASSVPRTTLVLFGPRITAGFLGVKVFAHGLVGGEHSANSGSSISGGAMTFAVGGGVDLPIAPFFSWRVMGDVLSAPSSSSTSGAHSRFGTGLVFRF